MFLKNSFGVLILLCAVVFGGGCFIVKSSNQIKPNREMPPTILWAWERGEDLRFLDTEKFGVAFLAQTLVLERDEVVFRPRRQPLQLAPETYLIAVTRIETGRGKNRRPSLSAQQKNEIISLIKRTLELPDVKAVQIDFDALASERDFYKSLARDLRANLPENTPLTITALASWCVGDAWFNEMPVDEAVPMAFRMGADDKPIRDFLAKGNDWREPLCKGSYGVALDEPLRETKFKPSRRFYVFNSESRGWKAEDLKRLPVEGVLR